MTLTIIVAVMIVGPVTVHNTPSYIYGQENAGTHVDMHILPVELDLRSETLRTYWFQLIMDTTDVTPFKLFIIYPTEWLPNRVPAEADQWIARLE